uniref:3'-N-debenzoyl-2'-deoxytaxol N-benzoyltransferase n=1 Tax=Ananas comosus var. bracteatus TaxID=296719 RepID=A0A6V7P0V2_ANACO|nr:unnamed protein product [Ananas comosus var. bracteatus]
MENVIFMMQVTEFKCGGFTVGITYNHTVFDGAGSAQFLNAPTPAHHFSPRPEGPKIQFTFDSFKLAEFDISLQSIKQVKDRVTAETGQSCSTFDVVTAVLWQSRTRAINLDPDADVSLSFMANARHVLHDLLSIEGGYYGNCVYTAGITLPSKQVANASLVVLVGLIREAKRTVSDGLSRWMNGDEATNLHALQDYRMLTVTDWNRLGYCEIDFGWGEPSFVYPCGCSSSSMFTRALLDELMKSMAGHCTITKEPAILVRACEPTPRGSLQLSFLDRLPGLRFSGDIVFVFRRGGRGEDPAKAISEGLSRALVHYYPVAGRIVEPAGGELEIECSGDGDGDGVWFVEASAECSLDGFGDWDSKLHAVLAARPPPELNHENVIFMVQLLHEPNSSGDKIHMRRFHRRHHLQPHSLRSAQFLNAVAELTRGLAEPTVTPTWRRESVPSPPKPTTSAQGPAGPDIQYTFYRFKSAEFDVSLHSINRVKDRVAAETGQICSTFDVVTAMLWQSRTRAINVEPDADVCLYYMANARHRLNELLSIEGGYYGNCVYPVGITLPSKQVVNGSLVALVGVIRQAKQTVSDGFSRWLKGEVMSNSRALPDYRMLLVSDWTRLGYYEVDYGWGSPSYVFPCVASSDFNVFGRAAFIKPPVPKEGVRLVMSCVEEQHSATLHDELMKFA